MRYLSVCSGIEAATCAFHPLGWTPAAFSEIEGFPAAVLSHHYPHVPNLGDMTNFKEWNIGPFIPRRTGYPDSPIDLLVGGTPCQSFSVAGLRKGLDDPRGNLALVYLGIAERFRPRWLLWENVPGVLSSNGGRDFGAFLGALAQLGYGFAYRVLDAQYFGVPQRRRRVFVVGCLGSWQRAAAVLFERDSLCGNPAPSREKGKGVAGGVTHSLTRRYDSSEDGSGRGTPLLPIGIDEECNATIDGFGPLLRGGQGGTRQAVMCMAHGQGNAEICSDGSPSLTCNHEAPIIAFPGQMSNNFQFDDNLSQTLGAKNPQAIAIQDGRGMDKKQNGKGFSEDGTACTLDGVSQQADQNLMAPQMQVRRLTPVECERLQGFSRNYTNIPWRNKPEAPDGPRYKALGNSMAVPVMHWLGKRIQMVDQV